VFFVSALRFSRVRIPQMNSCIRTCRGDLVSLWRPGKSSHTLLMRMIGENLVLLRGKTFHNLLILRYAIKISK
jgi:hypothetical protein